ncbi:EAL domain-containing protein [Paraglaciecola sp. L3A3]|uniref:EAL domain-containing protein n=1 Tax=Paraglaciecola sp. L3A3 TaxID=2686358 RepID=UPI00131B37D7|nr:EAL domain-containing protein [Paraglaciecola sp. L3A3]
MQVTEVKDSFSLDSVVPFFQPIMDLSHNTVWSYECLARLMTIDERTYLPSEFLYLVERQDLVAELTQIIFNRSASYFRDINMAWNINVSLSDIVDPTIHKFLTAQLSCYPNPSRISIEITAKNALISNSNFLQFANLCQSLGINIIIDHFEQDETELQTIMSLPISAIKVAGSLFEQASKYLEVANLVKTMVSLAAENNIVLIAEHIELASTLAAAQKCGIKYAQGFYFSQPKAVTH